MNKIFKTIWNRSRRAFVAVSEAVTRSAQADGKTAQATTVGQKYRGLKFFALSAVALAVLDAQGASISGNYSNLNLSGTFSHNVGDFYTECYREAEADDVFGQNVDPNTSRYVDKYYTIDYDIKEYMSTLNVDNKAIYVVDSSSDLSVSGNLTLGKSTVKVTGTVHSTTTRKTGGSGGDGIYTLYAETDKNYSFGNKSANTSLVNNGGTVNIGNLVLQNPDNSYTQNGGSTSIGGIEGNGSVIINDGTLSTSGGVLIDISEAKAADIGAYELFDSSKAITVTSLAAGEKSKVSGMSAQSDQFTINGGTLNIEGTYEQHIADQAEQLLKDYYGNKINVTFDEIVADQTLDLSNGYTTAVLNSIYDENGRGDVLFHSLNWNAQGKNLVIGDGDMVRNIGVKNIDNAKQVTVTGGKTFAILGDGTGRTVNGTFVADNGNLVFGAAGLTSGGTVSSVSMRNDGNVTVANGAFDFGSLSGDGNFIVAQSGSADLTDYVVDGRFTNAGSVTISGDLAFADGSEMTSSGNLTTGLDNVFQNVTPAVDDPLKVIGLNAALPEEIRSVATDLFQKYVPGEVAEALADHATFSGGKVTITGVNLTNTQVADLTQAFKEQLFSRNSLTSAFPVALI